jgi:hypothetical protein
MALAEEDLAAIQTLVNTTVNGAVSNLKKLAVLDRQKDAESMKESFGKLLDEKLQALAPPPEPGDGGKGGKGGKSGDVELATLKRQVEDLRKSSEESARVAASERAKNRSAKMRDDVREALREHGITDARFKAAYAMLQQDGVLRYQSDDSDDIVFADVTGEMDYRTGLATWAKSEDAKLFLPPSGTQGAGTRPKTGQPQMKGGPLTPAERAQKMNAALGEWADNSR